MRDDGIMIQLQAKGQEDIYLTKHPEITQMQIQFKRFEPFSMESIKLNFNHGKVEAGKTASVYVKRLGDLMHKTWLEIDINASSTNNIATAPIWNANSSFNINDVIKADVYTVSSADATTTINGSSIINSHNSQNFGSNINISSDGTLISVGAPDASNGSINTGGAMIYQNPTFSQLGDNIYPTGSNIETNIKKTDSTISNNVNTNQLFGTSLSLNGPYIAIGSKSMNNSTANTGGVSIYKQLALGSWTRQGADIFPVETGETPVMGFGTQVAINSTGDILIVSAPQYDYNGKIVVFEKPSGLAWNRKGNPVYFTDTGRISDTINDLIGDRSIACNSTGLTFAFNVQNTNHNTDGENGAAQVYTWDGSDWIQKGQTIWGYSSGNRKCVAVSLSSDGTTLSTGFEGATEALSYVQVWTHDNNSPGVWTQKGTTIDNNLPDSPGFHHNCKLSDDGNTIVVSTTTSGGANDGLVAVLQYTTDWNLLGQLLVPPTAPYTGNNFGYHIDISGDGTHIYIGDNLAGGKNYVYKYDSTYSRWKKLYSFDVDTTQNNNPGSLSTNGNRLAVGYPGGADLIVEGGTKTVAWDNMNAGHGHIVEVADLQYSTNFTISGGRVSHKNDTWGFDIVGSFPTTQWGQVGNSLNSLVSGQSAYVIDANDHVFWARYSNNTLRYVILNITPTNGGAGTRYTYSSRGYTTNAYTGNDNAEAVTTISNSFYNSITPNDTYRIKNMALLYDAPPEPTATNGDVRIFDSDTTSDQLIKFGSSAAMNDAGTIIICGCPHYSYDEDLTNVGAVIAFQLVGGATWTQKGSTITFLDRNEDTNRVNNANEFAGTDVACSSDGLTLATIVNNTTVSGNSVGQAKIITFSTDWDLKGSLITGTNPEKFLSIDMNSTGTRIAIATDQDLVHIYEYTTDWTPIGSIISPNSATTNTWGSALQFNSDASQIIIGGYGYSTNAGEVAVYEYASGTWNRIGKIFTGAPSEELGKHVSISGDGLTIAMSKTSGISYTWNATTRDWDGGTGNPDPFLYQWATGHKAVALSNDGARMALGNSTSSGDINVVEMPSTVTTSTLIVANSSGVSSSIQPTWSSSGNTDGTISWSPASIGQTFYISQAHDIYNYIDEIGIFIGNTLCDKHTSQYMKLQNELTIPNHKKDAFKYLTNVVTNASITPPNTKLRVPLSLWFSKHPQNALPLISLRDDEVNIYVKFSDALPTVLGASLWTDFIFLTDEQRQTQAISSHEFLFEQMQTTGSHELTPSANGAEDIIRMDFNHPVKELYWQLDDNNHDKLTTALIKFEHHDRFVERDADYFATIQRYQHHGTSAAATDKKIYIYSFAIHPDDLQPTGTINFSQINKATLHLKGTYSGTPTCTAFATNYNILKIQNGRAHVAFY